MYRLLKQEGRAKRGEFTTPHGVIQTPVFMNVGTVAAIKGAVSTEDLEGIKTQVELSNRVSRLYWASRNTRLLQPSWPHCTVPALE